ncbi:MAG: hypothetical protein O7A09_04755 [Proteobacteria bacterium]|nr:hypothetical protein [Pseudomonadota bacterium]
MRPGKRATGASNFTPLGCVERAGLAGRDGDREGRTSQLRSALERFEAIGAAGHSARVRSELAQP